jgi:hypothetical protein
MLIRWNEMGKACTINGSKVKEMYSEFWQENLKERDHWDDVVIDGLVLSDTRWCQWWTLVNTATNLRVP